MVGTRLGLIEGVVDGSVDVIVVGREEGLDEGLPLGRNVIVGAMNVCWRRIIASSSCMRGEQIRNLL